MSEPRDQLYAIARKLNGQKHYSTTAAFLLHFVDAILAAGWRPPARVITTDEELSGTVPDGTIVESAVGTIACRYDYGAGVVFGDDRPFPWQTLLLPVTVVREVAPDDEPLEIRKAR